MNNSIQQCLNCEKPKCTNCQKVYIKKKNPFWIEKTDAATGLMIRYDSYKLASADTGISDRSIRRYIAFPNKVFAGCYWKRVEVQPEDV